MSGQNIGAGKYDRAEQANLVAARALFGILAAAGVAIFLFPTPIVAVFTNDSAVLDVGVQFLRYSALSFGFIGIMRAFTGGFRGAGKTLTAAAISIVTLAGIRLPVAYIASRGILPTDLWFLGQPDARGIWIAFFASNVAGAIIAWLWFRRGTWRDGDVRGTDAPEDVTPDDVDPTTGD
jgi:Na+-driven multidrug efflux pump